ncbi:MAG: hypothetical protein IJG51_04410 [Synergistaceae bacterium]|nr:hypothetical protein [Synergistaceae bacterium]MBQ3347338.1 hypothetical protein [Synergistaceae bacterium]MBQ3398110.1 hypothetical protein [Synergistaceae bacterium]MBQ3758635.1 hypothetical protein [Synergistaceae bacterium]MBQ4402348.1 hypothetical protein [Synergistaceae bacterium]
MNEEFVRKDVHDAEIRRLDEKIEAAVSRIEFLLADMRLDIRRLDRDMEGLREKVRSLEAKGSNLSWDLVLIAAIFLLTVFFLSVSIRFTR